MADLKAGTTIGGTLVWTQGNFPLYPTGNTLLYKTFKVYSENDKPQAADNDFVSKANGGTYGGIVNFSKGLSIPSSDGAVANVNAVSLYGPYTGGTPTQGIFMGTTESHGTYGAVTGSWATYFKSASGGWIFKKNDIAIASIAESGIISGSLFNSSSAPTQAQNLTRKDYVDGLINTTTNLANTKVSKSGDTMTGTLTAPNIISSNLATTTTQVPQLGQVVQRGIILDYGTF